MKSLFIIGSGGFSKQVIEMVEEINNIKKEYNLIGLIDDNIQLIDKDVLGYKVLGDTDYLRRISENQNLYAVIAIGESKIREEICIKLTRINWVNLIHPKSTISRHTCIGEGNIICAGVIINPDCCIGNHSNINIGCTVGHDVNLRDFTTIMPGCNISGKVQIHKGSMIGTGSCIIQNILIKENPKVGAGSVVIKDVEKNSVYVGVPANKIGKLE